MNLKKSLLRVLLTDRTTRSQALHDIATLYFAIPPPRKQAANPFGDMLSSLFGGPAAGQPGRRVLTPATAATGLD